MVTFNINTDATVRFTNELEKLHRSALPNAVRGTLNKTAFDVKQKTMPKTADKSFVQRNKTFFKAASRVNMAKGWDIDRMQATVGFKHVNAKGSQAIEDLQQQEFGGVIKGRAFVPTNKARGGNDAKSVRPSNRMAGINHAINPAKIKTRKHRGRVVRVSSPAEQFTLAAIKAGKGGHVIGNKQPRMMLKITALKRVKGQIKVKAVELYEYQKGRVIQVKSTQFMFRASHLSARKMNHLYQQEARRQFERRGRKF